MPGALMVYLPASGLLFAGDVMMPYVGVPFDAEGSPEGLLDTMRYIRELAPRQLIAGHTTLTESFTIEALAGPGAGSHRATRVRAGQDQRERDTDGHP
jgi:glyoxylase-like metal-dependent hydrolase (beta-lactamase superfamily II)